jgi:hypothetical protein
MTEVIYNDPALKDAAFKLAEETPRHLDQPTTPPIHWREDAGLLRVLLADGRTVRGPMPVVGTHGVRPLKAKAPELMALPARTHEVGVHPVISSGDPPANLRPDGKKKAVRKPK